MQSLDDRREQCAEASRGIPLADSCAARELLNDWRIREKILQVHWEGVRESKPRPKSDVASCKNLGDVRTRTRSRVGFIDRDEKTVSKEFHQLARNEAVETGADTILAVETPTPEGTQKFRTYQCSRN